MKHVCVKWVTASWTAATTRGFEAPTEVTAMPVPKSMKVLPSTSRITPPSASAAYTGIVEAMALETAFERRAASSVERGPGTGPTSRRTCSRRGEVGVVMVFFTPARDRGSRRIGWRCTR
jgi:hypothetical protein